MLCSGDTTACCTDARGEPAALRDSCQGDVVTQLLQGLDSPLPLAVLLSRLEVIVALLVVARSLREQMIDDHQDFVCDGHRRLLPAQAHFQPSECPAKVALT